MATLDYHGRKSYTFTPALNVPVFLPLIEMLFTYCESLVNCRSKLYRLEFFPKREHHAAKGPRSLGSSGFDVKKPTFTFPSAKIGGQSVQWSLARNLSR